MTDKFRKTQPINITIASGENPTAEKLTAIASQSRMGSDLLERAIGDLWNESGDTTLIDTPLQIPNLARLLGENQYLNPALYPFQYDFYFDDRVGAKYLTETTGYLTFRPKASSTFTQVDAGTQFTTEVVTAEYDVDATGEYFVDDATGKFRTNEVLTSGVILRYAVDPTQYENDTELVPGIIPDPRQTTFKYCRVSQSGSTYYLHLPPRQPLTFSGNGYDGDESRPDKYPIDAEVADANNLATIVDANNLKYWQDPTVAALNHDHYRYHLPKEILDAYSSINVGAEYPSGYMYLWDDANKTIISDVVFKKPAAYPTSKWIMEVESTDTAITGAVTASEAEANYNSSNLILITCGSPLARSMWSVLSRQLKHKHDNTDSISTISHSSLRDLDPPVNTHADHTGRYPTVLPRWTSSRWAQDDHVSLLSRGGSVGGADATRRDPNDNAMLGHLVLANSVASSNVFLDATTPDNSFRLYFGAIGGSSIYQNSSERLTLESDAAMRLDASNSINIDSDDNIYIYAGDYIYMHAYDDIEIEAHGEIDLEINNVSKLKVDGSLITVTDPTNFTTGPVGIGTSNPDASVLHLINSPCSAFTFSSSADDFIIENDGNCGMTILSGPQAGSPVGSIYFEREDRTAAQAGRISYSHADEYMSFWVENDFPLRLYNDAVHVNGSGLPVVPQGTLCVTSTNLSGYTVDAQADNLVIFHNGDCGISIASDTTDTCRIHFDDTDASSGKIVYDHSTDNMEFHAAASSQLTLSSTQLTLPTNDLVVSTGHLYVSTGDVEVTAGDVNIDSGRVFAVNSGSAAIDGYTQYDNGYAATFSNTNGNANNFGIRIAAGMFSPSSTGDVIPIKFLSGNQSVLGEIRWNSSGPSFEFNYTSDRRLKTDIAPTKVNGLDIINNIPLFEFKRIDFPEEHPLFKIAYIADECEKVYPSMVHTDSQTGYKMVGDGCLVPILVKSIQEQQTMIEQLKSRLEVLESK